MKVEVGIEGVRVYHRQVSRFIFRGWGCWGTPDHSSVSVKYAEEEYSVGGKGQGLNTETKRLIKEGSSCGCAQFQGCIKESFNWMKELPIRERWRPCRLRGIPPQQPFTAPPDGDPSSCGNVERAPFHLWAPNSANGVPFDAMTVDVDSTSSRLYAFNLGLIAKLVRST